MAIPTAPTLTSLVAAGLDDAGISSPTPTQTTRGERFVEEVKADIVAVERRLTSLQTTSVLVTTNGQNRYALPTDFLSDLSMTRLDGSVTGTAQTGAIGSVTLEATDDSDQDNLGLDILIYEGTGKGSMSQITAYNSTTKVATVTPDFTTAPDSTSKYMKIDLMKFMEEVPRWEYDRNVTNPSQDAPTHFVPIGDADDGEIIIWPTPYRSSAVPWGLQLRYYADLMELDLTSTLLATLYKKWRNVWTLGITAKQFKFDDDDRQITATNKYNFEIQQMVAREKYGYDMTNLNMQVRNY